MLFVGALRPSRRKNTIGCCHISCFLCVFFPAKCARLAAGRCRRDGVQSHAGKLLAAARQTTLKLGTSGVFPGKGLFQHRIAPILAACAFPASSRLPVGRSKGSALRSGSPNGDLCWPTNPGTGAFHGLVEGNRRLDQSVGNRLGTDHSNSDSVHSVLLFGVFSPAPRPHFSRLVALICRNCAIRAARIPKASMRCSTSRGD